LAQIFKIQEFYHEIHESHEKDIFLFVYFVFFVVDRLYVYEVLSGLLFSPRNARITGKKKFYFRPFRVFRGKIPE